MAAAKIEETSNKDQQKGWAEYPSAASLVSWDTNTAFFLALVALSGLKASHLSKPGGTTEKAGLFFFLRYKSVLSFYRPVIFWS